MMPGSDIQNLSGRHIFLTGGTGSVGRTLIDYLDLSQASYGGLRVTALTRDPGSFYAQFPGQAEHSWLTLIQGSLAALPAPPPDVTDFIHAAAHTHAQTGHAGWINQIVAGTRTLLDAAEKFGAARFLLLSSGAVYGPQPPNISHLREDYHGAPDPLLASSTYGQAKRMAEQLCTVFHREQGVPTVVARLFAFGSVHTPRDGRHALGCFVKGALAADDAPITVSGDGTAVRSYLGGHDMAHGLITALVAGAPGLAYNIGSEEAVSIAELAHRVVDRLSPGRQITILGAPDDAQRSRYVPDVSRIAALGAARRTDLDEVIEAAAGVVAPRP